jgi:SpoIID/LytB domain protein
MSPSPTRAAILIAGQIRRFLGAPLALIMIATSAMLSTFPAHADSAVSSKSGSFTIRGAGWGHGWGMSQYGAYRAARKGLSWNGSWLSTIAVPN